MEDYNERTEKTALYLIGGSSSISFSARQTNPCFCGRYIIESFPKQRFGFFERGDFYSTAADSCRTETKACTKATDTAFFKAGVSQIGQFLPKPQDGHHSYG